MFSCVWGISELILLWKSAVVLGQWSAVIPQEIVSWFEEFLLLKNNQKCRGVFSLKLCIGLSWKLSTDEISGYLISRPELVCFPLKIVFIENYLVRNMGLTVGRPFYIFFLYKQQYPYKVLQCLRCLVLSLVKFRHVDTVLLLLSICVDSITNKHLEYAHRNVLSSNNIPPDGLLIFHLIYCGCDSGEKGRCACVGRRSRRRK